MDIGFPGGLAVEARFDGFTVRTDQPVEDGGAGSAPAPFDLFLASLGTCAGFFALRFCQERGIGTEGLGLTLDAARDPATHRLRSVRIGLHLPAGFPEKYRTAIVRAANTCAVKRAILDPPPIEVVPSFEPACPPTSGR